MPEKETPTAQETPPQEKPEAPEKPEKPETPEKPEPVAESETVSVTIPQPEKDWFWGLGRRKKSVARVRIKPGEGTFKVNKREINEYFRTERDRDSVVAPLKATDTFGKVDVHVNICGGGTTGQAGAIVLGIARALLKANEDYLEQLRAGDYLTRDSRMVERKKYGQRGARRRFQFSKR